MSLLNIECADLFEACRTCGVFYLTSSNYLRALFPLVGSDAETAVSEMMLIRMQLAAWNVEINDNDGFPQYMCTSCVLEFQKVFKFRRSCINMQQQLHELYDTRQQNKVKIKTEVPDASDGEEDAAADDCCDFIYVDDLSDTECNGGAAVTPFIIPHIPIKEEPNIQEATVPKEMQATSIEAAGAKRAQLVEELPAATALREKEDAAEVANSSNAASHCHLCSHVAGHPQELRQHMQQIHEVKNLECHICGKEFKNSTANRFKFHLRWHKLSKHVKCAQCGFFCNSRDTLKQHKRAMHAKIACDLCGKSIISRKMKAHLREHAVAPASVWECSYCKVAFSTEAAREEHLWQVHAAEDAAPERKITSPCEQAFTSQQDLNSYNAPQQQFTCYAEETSVRQENENLAEFSQAEHLNPIVEASNNYMQNNYEPCMERTDSSVQVSTSYLENSFAGSSASHANTLNESEQQNAEEHEGETSDTLTDDIEESANSIQQHQIACANCPQTFANVEEFYIHHQEHVKARPIFTCKFCGKEFDLKFTLNRHLKKHEAPL